MTLAVVAGGAGFVGSHLCDRLLIEGWEVVCVDSLLTGDESNLARARSNNRFTFMRADIVDDLHIEGPVDWVLNLASPASPIDYLEHPIETLKVGSIGTLHCLDLAREKEANLLIASTSEVYGDPMVHPQPESYWGNVNPIGPRSVYDEAKRFSEALTMAYHRTHGLPVRIIRIFNTFGPRMRRDDGRAVPTFMAQALRQEPITVHGDGSQTRSLCYVDDLVEGIWRMMGSAITGPVNLGNPQENTILEIAELIRGITGSSSPIRFTDRPVDDPEVRRPDITYARSALGWEPSVPLVEGIRMTLDSLQGHLDGEPAATISGA